MHLGMNGQAWWQFVDTLAMSRLIAALKPNQRFAFRFRGEDPHLDPAELDQAIAMHNDFEAAGVHVDYIYCAEVERVGSEVDQMANIAYLIAGGCNIVAVEFGNETYSMSQANFVFATYQAWYTPLLTLVAGTYPTMPCLVFLAPRPNESGVLSGNNNHSVFNNLAIAAINANPRLQPVIHIYFSFETPGVVTPPTGIVYNPAVYEPALDAFYTDLYDDTITNFNLWELTLSYVNAAMPSKLLWITEWGYDEYSAVRNTIACGMMAWKIWNTYGKDQRLAALLQHSMVGMLKEANNKDLNPAGDFMLRRMDFWAYAMYRLISDINNVTELPLHLVNNTPGIYTYWYINFDDTFTEQLDNVSISDGYSVSGLYPYTTSGFAEYMTAGTTQNYDVNNYYPNFGLSLPMSFGIRNLLITDVPKIMEPEENPAPPGGDEIPTPLENIPGDTVAFNYEKNGWETWYSYRPDFMVRLGDDLFSFSGGLLWINNRNPIRNNFHGVQYTSRIRIVSNEAPKSVKNYYTIRISPSKGRWKVLEAKIPPYKELPNGMISKITASHFSIIQGDAWADFFRDMGDPSFADPNLALARGRVLSGHVIEVEIENDSTGEVILLNVHISSDFAGNTV